MSCNNCCDPCQGYYEPYQYYEPYLYYDENGILREDWGWEDLKKVASSTWDKAKEVGSTVVKAVTDIANNPLFAPVVDWIKSNVKGMVKNFVDNSQKDGTIAHYIQQAFDGTKYILSVVVKAVSSLLEGSILEQLKKRFAQYAELIKEYWPKVWEFITDKGRRLSELIGYVLNVLNEYKESVAKSLGINALSQNIVLQAKDNFEIEGYLDVKKMISDFIQDKGMSLMKEHCENNKTPGLCRIKKDIGEILINLPIATTEVKEAVLKWLKTKKGTLAKLAVAGFGAAWSAIGGTAIKKLVEVLQKLKDKFLGLLNLPLTFNIKTINKSEEGYEYFENFEFFALREIENYQHYDYENYNYETYDYEPYTYNTYCNC